MSNCKEASPRAGFFEADQCQAVRRRLRPDLQVAVGIAYTYGWRVRDEVLTLERRHVDIDAGTIRLDPGTTKNGEGRLVYLAPEVTAALAAQLDRVRALERQTGRIVPFVFPSWPAGSKGSACATSAGHGGPPARGPGARGCSVAISGGRRCGTW